jgi:hypothetical protein
MRIRAALILATSLLSTACSGWPTGPTGLTDRDGFSVSVVDVQRPWAPSQLLSIRVDYTLAEMLDEATIWTCLARTTDTVIVSSCRSAPAAALTGTLQLTGGIYWVNDIPVVPVTRYVAAFVTSGELYRDRMYPPLEMKVSDLTSRIAARVFLETSWPWDRLTKL